MGLEEPILLYYLRTISLFIILVFLYLFYIFFIKEIKLNDLNLTIQKNQSPKSIINSNINNLNSIEKIISQMSLSIYSKYIKNIHYGVFVLPDKVKINEFISIITEPSNFILKITIVEGWSKYELNEYLKSHFNTFNDIDYVDILADTYFLHSYEDFNSFFLKLKNIKQNKQKNYKNHVLLEQFSFDELIIIGSLLEKEGIDELDKKLIFSVIQNRLKKNMKLQIDATTIFAITDGKYDLNRDLKIKDLKFKHPYNTYHINGLPPGPISYVGKKTMEIIFENYKSKYLYYFYDNIVQKHIYSETYKDHKRKLSEYRSKK